MTPVNVAPYIPQRPPVLVVDSFSECNNSLIITEYKIPQDHIFVQDGHLSSAGLIENIAQTCATRIGWLNRDKPVKIGVIGSVSNLEIFRLPFIIRKTQQPLLPVCQTVTVPRSCRTRVSHCS